MEITIDTTFITLAELSMLFVVLSKSSGNGDAEKEIAAEAIALAGNDDASQAFVAATDAWSELRKF